MQEWLKLGLDFRTALKISCKYNISLTLKKLKNFGKNTISPEDVHKFRAKGIVYLIYLIFGNK